MRRTLLSRALLTSALLTSVSVLLLLPVTVASGATPGPSTGLQGFVKQLHGGMCASDDPCDGVGRGVLLVFTRAGQPAHRVRSNDEGLFRLRLAPGRYRVLAGASASRVMPSAVIVPAKGFARVTITVGSPGMP